MTVETDLEKQVDEVTEKMDNKLLSTNSINGENLEKHVRNLRSPIVLGRGQHGVVKWFSVAKGLFFYKK